VKRRPAIVRWAVAYIGYTGAVERILFPNERGARAVYRQIARRECQAQRIYPLPRPIRNGPRRRIGGVRFVADRPGWWFSECGRFAVLRQPGGRPERWGLYRQDRDVRGDWLGGLEFVQFGASLEEISRSPALRKAS
jgi:hypothetical protein